MRISLILCASSHPHSLSEFPDVKGKVNIVDLAEDIEAELFRVNARIVDDRYKVRDYCCSTR